MLNEVKKTVKSETMIFSYILIIAGVIQVNLPLLKGNFGEYYGVATTVIGIVVAVLRMRTTKPLKEL